MVEEDDPFDDLDATLGDEPDQTDDTAQRTDRDTHETPDMADSTTDDTTDAATDTEPDDSAAIEEPAFSFDEAKQSPLYARQATWDQFEDALDFEVRRSLRDRGAREISKRELHDAVLQVAADHADEIADVVEQMRRE